MIFVFVVDTAPSMASPVDGGLTRLDLAKMAVEDWCRQYRKRCSASEASSSLYLLSTYSQHQETSTCAAGGRLLVGSDDEASFQRELKLLKTATEDEGVVGMNACLSTGLQLMSRFRLQHRVTENFGMGRIPHNSVILPNGAPVQVALMPACLVVLSDGECFRKTTEDGSGKLQLQMKHQMSRDFYVEPFRWDHRICSISIGSPVDAQLRELIDVSGGLHGVLDTAASISSCVERHLKLLFPPVPPELPLPDHPLARTPTGLTRKVVKSVPGAVYPTGGPICCFQQFEPDPRGHRPTWKALLLYAGSEATTHAVNDVPTLASPLWIIPEAYFPSKKLDSLPPRAAHPTLVFSRYPSNLGSKSFDPPTVVQQLQRLDELIAMNRQMMKQPIRLLHRDTYVCIWLSDRQPPPSDREFFPISCPGAGRPAFNDEESFFHIGVLDLGRVNAPMSGMLAPKERKATLTLLPPEPHILLPLLLRAAEMEHRTLKKGEKSNKMVLLDDTWRSEFRAYMFRLPPYYQHSVKRCLRAVLPPSVHTLLQAEPVEAIIQQYFSKQCLQRIRNNEQLARDNNERQERQETMVRQRPSTPEASSVQVGYGQYNAMHGTVDSFLASIRNQPAPWLVKKRVKDSDAKSDTVSILSDETPGNSDRRRSVDEVLGDLPKSCLMAYYESRRRWIFGGPSLTVRGLHVEGVPNDGSNSQRCSGSAVDEDPCILALGGVGVSMLNQTLTSKMGDYRERLVYARSPIVGSGSNDLGVAATTAIDGSPTWSVDDDAFPLTFFDPKTGEFVDSVENRVRTKLAVNFGNPYKEKRGDSIVPEKYLDQIPSRHRKVSQGGGTDTPQGSPPHDSFDSVEEDEAIFVRSSPSKSSPKRDEPDTPESLPTAKRPRSGSTGSDAGEGMLPKPPSKDIPPPPPPPKRSTSLTKGAPPPPPPKPQPPKNPQDPPATPRPRSNSLNRPPPPVSPGMSPVNPPAKRPPTQGGRPPPPSGKSPTIKTPIPPTPTAVSATVSKGSSAPPLPNIPDGAQSAAPTEVKRRPSISGASTLDLQRPDVKPSVDLPPGWMCVWSKSQKRWYFFNTKNNKSVWEWPPSG